MKVNFFSIKGRVILFSFLLYIVSSFFFTAHAEQSNTTQRVQSYSMGVFPFLPAARLEGVFAPIAAELSESLNKRILYKSASTFVKFMDRLKAQEFDIAMVHPFDYVRIAAPAGYLPVAARNGKLGAVFVVKKNSAVQSLLDLKGKTIAMAPKVAALSYLAQSTLANAGLDLASDLTIQHQKGHHSCLQQVTTGKADACATGEPALRMFEKQQQVQLDILARTPTIPDILFVVHPRISKQDKTTITNTLLNSSLAGVADDLKLLFLKNKDNPFIAISDHDYGVVYEYWQKLNTQ